jgi:hypothetical protein
LINNLASVILNYTKTGRNTMIKLSKSQEREILSTIATWYGDGTLKSDNPLGAGFEAIERSVELADKIVDIIQQN